MYREKKMKKPEKIRDDCMSKNKITFSHKNESVPEEVNLTK